MIATYDEIQIKSDFDDDDAQSTTFRVKQSIGKKLSGYYSRINVAIWGAAVIVVLIIVVGTVIHQTASDSAITNTKSKLSRIVLLGDKRLWSYDTSSKQTTLLLETNDTIGPFYTYSKETLLWVESKASTIWISSNEQKSTFFHDPRVNTNEMAIDYLTGNVYIVDQLMSGLIVMNVHSKNYSLLLMEISSPSDIILDPGEGLMFILQQSEAILRLNMDGTSRQKIIEKPKINAIALDTYYQRIYRIENHNKIISSDYEGNNEETVLTDDTNIASLAISDGELFWLWPAVEHPPMLWSCRIRNVTCEDHVKHPIDHLNEVKSIKVDEYRRDEGESHHACAIDNGGCQHLCLLTSDKNRSCVCNLGWQLNPDSRTCREVRGFMLFIMADYVRARILDVRKSTSFDAVWPTPYKNESVAMKGDVDFDYDMRNDVFYFSDDKSIYRTRLRVYEEQRVVFRSEKDDNYVKDVAYDWLTGNLYYVIQAKGSPQGFSLMVFNVEKGSNSKLGYDDPANTITYLSSVVLQPKLGYMFFVSIQDYETCIRQNLLNGTHVREVSYIPYVHDHRLLAIDYQADRVYWISSSSGYTQMNHATFNGTDLRTFSVDTWSEARTVSVYQQWLYLSTHGGIYRVNKETGIDAVRVPLGMMDDVDWYVLESVRRIAGVRVMSTVIQAGESST